MAVAAAIAAVAALRGLRRRRRSQHDEAGDVCKTRPMLKVIVALLRERRELKRSWRPDLYTDLTRRIL